MVLKTLNPIHTLRVMLWLNVTVLHGVLLLFLLFAWVGSSNKLLHMAPGALLLYYYIRSNRCVLTKFERWLHPRKRSMFVTFPQQFRLLMIADVVFGFAFYLALTPMPSPFTNNTML